MDRTRSRLFTWKAREQRAWTSMRIGLEPSMVTVTALLTPTDTSLGGSQGPGGRVGNWSFDITRGAMRAECSYQAPEALHASLATDTSHQNQFPLAPCGKKERGRIGHDLQSIVKHLEDADLFGGPVSILDPSKLRGWWRREG